MRGHKTNLFRSILLFSGAILVASALVMLIFWQWSIHTSAEASVEYVDTLRRLVPEPQGAVPEARRDNTMPVLAVEGTDFVGILEMPRFGSALPVGADWGKTSRYPCWFSGSVYDRSLQIGATSQKGQYEFYREINLGDVLYFTDMTGNRYTYTVTDIRYASHADQAALSQEEAALTLFIKNVYGFDYILIFCDVAG